MHNELRLATSDLARFLQEKLPELSEDWWAKHVVDRLSFQQQRVIGEKTISSMRELDFAALLRVLDQNWYDLSGNCNLPREARNWVKELQTVRNKWAHVSAEETPASEIYRDADTLGRLLNLIGAHERSMNAIRAVKESALARMTDNAGGTASAAVSEPNTVTAPTKAPPTEAPIHLFKVGDVVALRSDNSVKLPVLEVIIGGPETRYCVFQDGAKASYHESQLQAVAGDAGEQPSISIDEFRARLPQGHESFVRPSEASRDALPEGFPFDPGMRWLKAVKWGEDVVKRSEQQRQKETFARELGFSDLSTLERAKRFASLPPEEQERFLADWERNAAHELPDHSPANPERRASRVGEMAADAPERRTEERTRSVSVGREDVKAEAGQYLLQQYVTDNELFCQVCKKPMPFKLDDGSA